MAATTLLNSAFAVAAGNKTVTGTPTVADLLVCVCVQTGSAVVGSLTDNNPDGHGTYFAAVSAIFNTSADVVTIFVRADTIQRSALTTFTFVPGGVITGGGIAVLRTTGMTQAGPRAIRQSGSQANQAAATTPAPVFGVAALTGNAIIGTVANKTNPATMTPPTSFVEPLDTGYATTTPSGLEIATADSGITASTITWGGTSASAFGDAVVELDTRAGRTSIFPAVGGEALDISLADTPKLQGVKRSAFFCFGDKWARRGPLWVPA